MNQIIYNIFKNKTYSSIFFITVLLLTLIIVFKNFVFVPLFKKDLINNTLNEAVKVSKHLSRTLDFKNANNTFNQEIDLILKEFSIDSLHYFSKDGVITYSTDIEKIGDDISKDEFFNIIKRGKVYFKVKNKKHLNSNSNSNLIEIYIPIMDNSGNFMYALEFYYDISDKISTFENNVKKIDTYMNVFNLIFFFIICTLLYYSSKSNLKDKAYQDELQNFRNIIDETKAYVFTKDLNGCYTFANKLVLDLFKISLDDLIGKDDSHFFDLEVSNELKKNDNIVMKKGISIENEELNIIKETGERRVYWSVKRPLYDNNEKIIGMAGISTDITERKLLEKEIKEQKKLLDIILDNVDAYIYIKDINRNFRYVNAKTAELFRKPLDEIVGHKDTEVLPREMADIFWESDRAVFEKDEKVSTEEEIVDPKGEVKHYWSTKLPYLLNEERVLIGFSSDITDIFLLKEKLKKQAITDSLTSLYNKRHFETVAESEYQRSIRQNIDMSIVIFDIDFFKQINDNYGHHAGDKILEEASKIFISQIRKEDTLFRVGGEEFTIILPHTDSQKAFELSERIRTVINNKSFDIDNDKQAIFITLSFGVSSIIKTDKKYEDILLRADNALYKAKNNGRNQTIKL